MIYKSFTEMPVWQNAHNLSIEIFKLSVVLPRSEDYGLTSQIRKSSNGVTALYPKDLVEVLKKTNQISI